MTGPAPGGFALCIHFVAAIYIWTSSTMVV